MATFTRDNLKPPMRHEVVGIADQNYYDDGRGNVVTEDHADQAWLIVGKGCHITGQMVGKYGNFNKVAQDDASAEPEADARESSAKKSAKTKNEGVK